MRREWEPEELISCWTLLEEDRQLLANKSGATRLGFALLLKYFEIEGRFPRHAAEVPKAAVDYVGDQVKVAPQAFADYQWSGRTIEYHRAQVRKALGFREATVGDEDKLAAWLADEVCPVELSDDRLRGRSSPGAGWNISSHPRPVGWSGSSGRLGRRPSSGSLLLSPLG